MTVFSQLGKKPGVEDLLSVPRASTLPPWTMTRQEIQHLEEVVLDKQSRFRRKAQVLMFA